MTVQVRFEAFGPANQPVTGSVALDGTVVKAYDGITFSASDYTLVFSQPTTAGDHTLRGDFTWPGLAAGENTSTTKTTTCPSPPAPPAGPATAPPAPGAGTAPAAGGSPSAGTSPNNNAAVGERLPSGIARLRGASGCMSRAFRARVTGRSIASVVFRLDGRVIRRTARAQARYSVRVRPRRLALGRHRVVARVTFLSASETRARTLRMTFRRCGRGEVSPRFTG